jgi:prolyl oligopeptidase
LHAADTLEPKLASGLRIFDHGAPSEVVDELKGLIGVFTSAIPGFAAWCEAKGTRIEILRDGKRLTDLPEFSRLKGRKTMETPPRQWDDIEALYHWGPPPVIVLSERTIQESRHDINEADQALHELAHLFLDYGIETGAPWVEEMARERKAALPDWTDPAAINDAVTDYSLQDDHEFFADHVQAIWGRGQSVDYNGPVGLYRANRPVFKTLSRLLFGLDPKLQEGWRGKPPIRDLSELLVGGGEWMSWSGLTDALQRHGFSVVKEADGNLVAQKAFSEGCFQSVSLQRFGTTNLAKSLALITSNGGKAQVISVDQTGTFDRTGVVPLSELNKAPNLLWQHNPVGRSQLPFWLFEDDRATYDAYESEVANLPPGSFDATLRRELRDDGVSESELDFRPSQLFEHWFDFPSIVSSLVQRGFTIENFDTSEVLATRRLGPSSSITVRVFKSLSAPGLAGAVYIDVKSKTLAQRVVLQRFGRVMTRPPGANVSGQRRPQVRGADDAPERYWAATSTRDWAPAAALELARMREEARIAQVELERRGADFLGFSERAMRPLTRPDNTEFWMHGERIADPYRWLEADSPEMQKWTKVQEEYTADELRGPLREALRRQIEALRDLTPMPLPTERGGVTFKLTQNQDHERLALTAAARGKEKVIFDGHQLPPGARLERFVPSPDGTKVALLITPKGTQEAEVWVIDASGKLHSKDKALTVSFSQPIWLADSTGFLYERRAPTSELLSDDDLANLELVSHRIGTPLDTDRVIDGALGDSRFGRKMMLSSDGKTLYRVLLQPDGCALDRRQLESPDSAWTRLVDTAGELRVYERDGHVYATSDGEEGRGQLYVVQNGAGEPVRPQSLVDEGTDVLRKVTLVKDKIAVEYLHDAKSRVRIFDREGNLERELDLPKFSTVRSMIADGDDLKIDLETFFSPQRIFRYSVTEGELTEVGGTRVLDEDKYHVEQTWYFSPGGARAPMFLVYRNDIELDGKRPTLMSVYGGAGKSKTPEFTPTQVPLLEAGGVLAIPTLPGGGEFGREWTLQGNGPNKQVAIDFALAAAKRLQELNIASPETLAVTGYGNGGIVSGNLALQAPDHFRAAIVGQSLTDMLRFQQLGLGNAIAPEYGYPDRNERDFKALRPVSTYHRALRGGASIDMLVDAAELDQLAPFAHSRKLTAALQQSGAKGLAFLRVEHGVGHYGATTYADEIDRTADVLTFIFQRIGLTVDSDDLAARATPEASPARAR